MAYFVKLSYLPGLTGLSVVLYGLPNSLLEQVTLTENGSRAGFYEGTGIEADVVGWYGVDILSGVTKIGDGYVKVNADGVGVIDDMSISDTSAISVNISPSLAINNTSQIPRTDIRIPQHEVDPEMNLLIVDQDGDAIDMEDKTLYLVLVSLYDGTRTQIDNSDISVTTNHVVVVLPPEIADVHGSYSWVLREVINKKRWGNGTLMIEGMPE